MSRFEYPDKLKRRGGALSLFLPKRLCDEMGIEADQRVMVRINRRGDNWIVQYVIPVSSDEPTPDNGSKTTVICSEDDGDR